MKIEVDPAIFLIYRARDIQTTMDSHPLCVQVDEQVDIARRRLQEAGFDQSPVQSNGTIVGWILTDSLKDADSINSVMRNLSQGDLMSADAPLNDLLQRLVRQKLIFLVGKDGIEGFVVQSDIGRHVSRAHLYLLISGLEIMMAKVLSTYFLSTEELILMMNPSSRQAYESEKRQGFDANPIEYLDLRAFGKAMTRNQPVMNHLAISVTDWNSYIERLVRIRNWVAHSNQEGLQGHPFSDIVEKMSQTEKFVKRLISF